MGQLIIYLHESHKKSTIHVVRPIVWAMAGPMIASFFDSSNLTADESSNDQSPVLIVENIPIVSNWWGMNSREMEKPGK